MARRYQSINHSSNKHQHQWEHYMYKKKKKYLFDDRIKYFMSKSNHNRMSWLIWFQPSGESVESEKIALYRCTHGIWFQISFHHIQVNMLVFWCLDNPATFYSRNFLG